MERMTREEKQKAIDVLKISAPIMAVTQEEFKDYIQSLNKIMDWLEQEPTTKNDLGVDCVARQDVERFIEGFINEYTPEEELEFINLELDGLKHLPPATPQELKPMVEIDLDYVIKQKYIEREVLDKIRAEILEEHENAYAREDNDTAYGLSMALDILDKYKSGGSKEA